MHWFLMCFVVVLAGFAKPALATQWTDSEIKAMPPYCAARLHKEPAKYDYWKSVLGPDYIHTHHFCAGIGYLNRYYNARDARSKGFNLNNALGNLSYMVSHASTTYSLMPEVYLNRGLVLSLMHKDGEAISDMLKAIELNPSQTRAYSVAADYYAKLNKKDEALKLATEGLRHNPESSVLQHLYIKMGGQLPYPEAETRQDPMPTEAISRGGLTDSVTEATKVPAPAIPLHDAESRDSEVAPETTSDKPKIGSPSNPWCRFCPPEPD